MVGKNSLKLYLVVSLGLGLVLTGCTRTPLYIDKGFLEKPIDTVTLLPVVDIRKDKTAATINAETDVRKPIEKLFAKKGYAVRIADSFTDGAQPVPDAIVEMDVSELAKLGPTDSQNLFIFYLEDLSTSYVVMQKTSKIEASAMIVDKKNHRYLWKDKCVASVGKWGLISGLLPIQGLAVDQCLSTISRSIPKR